MFNGRFHWFCPEERPIEMAEKSLFFTYVLWLTFGWLGVHHFYLRRDRHAFVWFWTAGGCFGTGWFLEIFRLPSYVEAANDQMDEYLRSQRSLGRQPRFSWKRFIGELIFSLFVGNLSLSAVPEDVAGSHPWITFIAPFFVALGVHTVANIGNESCSYSTCLLGAVLPLPMFLLGGPENISTAVSYSCLASAIAANWQGRWWKKPVADTKISGLCVRLFVLSAASLVLFSMILSTLYFNSHVTTRDGERIRLKDAIHNIFTSPAWASFRETVRRLYRHLMDDGFERFKRELSIVLDPEGEESAYATLGLKSTVTEEELTRHYRQLVKTYHPDKVKFTSVEEKESVERKFMEIQQAYERLSTIKQRRTSKNRHKVEL